MSGINNVSGNLSVNASTSSSSSIGDIQLEFAKLQMDLANVNKDDAMGRIKSIKSQQQKTAELVDLINKLRDIASSKTKDDDKVNIPSDLANKAAEFGVSISSGDVTVASAKAAIQSLEAKKDTIGSDVQQEMVMIQDAMGKYSAYTNGATSQISKYSDTLTSVARGQ